ncbi:MAG: hypothetical protein KAW83_05585 [Dehalococcoidia bacterium]|nr:hypothetical protein [Dehalococcoidia bacterium]
MTEDNLSKKSLAKWQDMPNDGSLDTFAKLTYLSSDTLRLTEPGVTILPNNAILAEISKDKNLFTQTTKDVLVALQDGGVQAHLYDDGREKRELILDSADVILPILLFLGKAAATVGLGILASWIYDRWIKTGAKRPPSVRAEYVEIGQHRTVVRWRRIEGQVPEIQRLLSEEAQILAKQDSANRVESSATVHEKAAGESWWTSHCKNSAHAALAVANDLIQEAEEAISRKKMDVAETLYRRSLGKIREALLWEPEEKSHSKYLHDVGRQIHGIFGCQLEFKDGLYWVKCPVMLSHSKGGFSIGGSGNAICSICGNDIFDCPHVKGNTYDGVVAKRHYDICNICGQQECNHKEGETYKGVRAFAIVTELNLDHVSFVQNPANPLCVVHGYSVPKSDLLEMLPEDERNRVIYGETIIHCSHCLTCKGN